MRLRPTRAILTELCATGRVMIVALCIRSRGQRLPRHEPAPHRVSSRSAQAVAAELTPGGLSRRRLGPADRVRPTLAFWCPRESRRVRTHRGQPPRQSSSTAARYRESLYGDGQKANSRSPPRRAGVRARTIQAIQRRSFPDPGVNVLARMSEPSLTCPKFTVRRSSPAARRVW